MSSLTSAFFSDPALVQRRYDSPNPDVIVQRTTSPYGSPDPDAISRKRSLELESDTESSHRKRAANRSPGSNLKRPPISSPIPKKTPTKQTPSKVDSGIKAMVLSNPTLILGVRELVTVTASTITQLPEEKIPSGDVSSIIQWVCNNEKVHGDNVAHTDRLKDENERKLVMDYVIYQLKNNPTYKDFSVDDIDNAIKFLTTVLNTIGSKSEKRKEIFIKNKREVIRLKEVVSELEDRISKLTEAKTNLGRTNSQLVDKLVDNKAEYKLLERENATLKEELKSRDEQIKDRDDQIKDRDEQIEARDEEIRKLKAELEAAKKAV